MSVQNSTRAIDPSNDEMSQSHAEPLPDQVHYEDDQVEQNGIQDEAQSPENTINARMSLGSSNRRRSARRSSSKHRISSSRGKS